MPTLAKINGIVIRMFYKDHPPPHFHATNSDKTGLFNINSLKMFKGNLSNIDQKDVVKWASNKQVELLKMWDTQKIIKIN